MVAGCADGVRTTVQLLLEHHSSDSVTALAGEALLWCGDFAGALEHLPSKRHVRRARAHAQLGQFDQALDEIELAMWSGDPDAKTEAFEVIRLGCLIGNNAIATLLRSERFAPLASSGTSEPNSLTELVRSGDWDRAMAVRLMRRGELDQAIARMKQVADRVGTWGLGQMPRYGRENLLLWKGERVDHLLIVANAGNGDFFHYGRYVPLARKFCKRLSLIVEPGLQAIAKRCLPIDDVARFSEIRPLIQQADAYQILDFWRLGKELDAGYAAPMRIDPLPGSVPCLGAGRHIGLAWASSETLRSRWIPFDVLTPLQSLSGVRFHSLQVGTAAHQAGEWVVRHDLQTYDDTTSLIAALDAVVTVDTSVAHLSANVGAPVHMILTPEHQDLRWGDADTTPWYPGMRIYRGDVAESVKLICERLASEALQAA
jgi:hypothetical protein